MALLFTVVHQKIRQFNIFFPRGESVPEHLARFRKNGQRDRKTMVTHKHKNGAKIDSVKCTQLVRNTKR